MILRSRKKLLRKLYKLVRRAHPPLHLENGPLFSLRLPVSLPQLVYCL